MEPTAYQHAVLEIPEEYNLFLGGGRGGGKSTAGCLLVLRHVEQYGEHAKVLMVRQSYLALEEIETTLVKLFNHAYNGRIQYNQQKHKIWAPGGGTVELGQLKTRSDYLKFQGRETTLLFCDEVTQYASQTELRKLRSNLRGPVGVPLRTIYAANPGGAGHVEVSRAHINGRVPWRPYRVELTPIAGETEVHGSTWVTCPSVLDDNPHIDQDEYRAKLREACLGDENLLKAWLKGDWDAVGGAFFLEHWGPWLLIEDDGWKPTVGWDSLWSFDYGMSAPGCALGGAVAEDRGLVGPHGVVYPHKSKIITVEVHSASREDPARGLEWPINRWAEKLVDAGVVHGITPKGVADDARGLGLDDTVISKLKEGVPGRGGLSMVKPNKTSRIAGWGALKTHMLATKKADPDQPWLHIVATKCPYLCETLPALPRHTRHIEDCDTNANDHAADALRYFVLPPPVDEEFEEERDSYIRSIFAWWQGGKKATPEARRARLEERIGKHPRFGPVRPADVSRWCSHKE